MKSNGEKKRRDRLEIVAHILEAAARGSLKTPLMYTTNLNFSQFEQHIATLIETGLVEIQDNGNGKGKIYKTTEKGNLLLQRLKDTSWIFKEIHGEEDFKIPVIRRESKTYFINK